MADKPVCLFSPRAISIIQEHGLDVLRNLTHNDSYKFTNSTDIFQSVVRQEYTCTNLQHEEMPVSPQWLWFSLCNRAGFFRRVHLQEPIVTGSLCDKLKSIYRLFYTHSDYINLDDLVHCLERIVIEEDDTLGCNNDTKKMVRFFYMVIGSILEHKDSILGIHAYMNKTQLYLEYITPRSDTDTEVSLSSAYVEDTGMEILLFHTVLRLISVLKEYYYILVNSYIFAPGVLHYFFYFDNDKHAIIEITDRFTFIHEENNELVYFLKSVGESFYIQDFSSHWWWDTSIINTYHHSVYNKLGQKAILAPIRHDLSDFNLVRIDNIEHALERSRLRGELQLAFVDKDYKVITIKDTFVDKWKELSLYFMAPFMKIQGFPTSYGAKHMEKWTKKHSLWIATAAAHIFIGKWTNMLQLVDESRLNLMPIEIQLFAGPTFKTNVKTYNVLLPLLVNNHQKYVSGVYGDCMLASQNGHWHHISPEVLFLFILCKKYPLVKTWLLNVNSVNNKEFVKSLHPLMSSSYNNPQEITLDILQRSKTEDHIIEHTANLLKCLDKHAWAIIEKHYMGNANLKPIFYEDIAVDNFADG